MDLCSSEGGHLHHILAPNKSTIAPGMKPTRSSRGKYGNLDSNTAQMGSPAHHDLTITRLLVPLSLREGISLSWDRLSYASATNQLTKEQAGFSKNDDQPPVCHLPCAIDTLLQSSAARPIHDRSQSGRTSSKSAPSVEATWRHGPDISVSCEVMGFCSPRAALNDQLKLRAASIPSDRDTLATARRSAQVGPALYLSHLSSGTTGLPLIHGQGWRHVSRSLYVRTTGV
ncbi:hypothetical protein FA13DRAFT_1781570, partial [Coprinellus micaceus]